MYKDKDKQREAQRDWVRQKRKGSTLKGSTKQGSTTVKPSLSVSRSIGPEDLLKPTKNKLIDKPKHDKDIKCITIGDQARSMKTMAMLHSDACKRGKDIKCFADLSPSVQQAIDKDSMFKGKIDKAIKIKRTEAAIRYQHAFPDRYDLQDAVISGPAVTSKPGDADYNGVCTEAWRAERGR